MRYIVTKILTRRGPCFAVIDTCGGRQVGSYYYQAYAQSRADKLNSQVTA